MNIKEGVTVAVSCISLMGIGYAAALRGGYVVDEAMAGDIVQQSVQQEAVARERGQLELQRELKFNQLRLLAAKSKPTSDEKLEADLLRQDIERINKRLDEL